MKFNTWCTIMLLTIIARAQDTVVITALPVYDVNAETREEILRIDSFYRAHQVDIALANNPHLYFEVFRWIGTRYCYAGSGFTGTDCSGFVGKVYQAVYGINLPRSSVAMYSVCQPIDKNEVLAEGDLVFFTIRRSSISHVGIYLQQGKFVHASLHQGVVISDLSDPYYQRYYYGAGRVQ